MNASRLTAPLALVVLGIYLFATAPTVLAEERSTGESMSADTLFRMLANEKDVARTLYTKEIVGPGKERGLAFREEWADPNVCAGPLPALFLRSCAQILYRSPHPLKLRLGSDFPIEASNRFNEEERKVFDEVRARRGSSTIPRPASASRCSPTSRARLPASRATTSTRRPPSGTGRSTT